MFNWLTKPIKKTLYKRYREGLEGEFHKNGRDGLERCIDGIRLLTEPCTYEGPYLSLTPTGRVTTAITEFDIAHLRLEHFLWCYRTNTASEQHNPDWAPLPDHLSKQKDKWAPRWVDTYMGTSSGEEVREKLLRIKPLLVELYLILGEGDNPTGERAVLFNTTRHIVRELEGLVEHYL